MALPLSHVLNKALPDFVYILPNNIALQLSLTRFWCRSSITRLTTKSKRAPTSTTLSFVKVFYCAKGYATHKNNFSVYSSYSNTKEGAYIKVTL
jgi:hypothetical protein